MLHEKVTDKFKVKSSAKILSTVAWAVSEIHMRQKGNNELANGKCVPFLALEFSLSFSGHSLKVTLTSGSSSSFIYLLIHLNAY